MFLIQRTGAAADPHKPTLSGQDGKVASDRYGGNGERVRKAGDADGVVGLE